MESKADEMKRMEHQHGPPPPYCEGYSGVPMDEYPPQGQGWYPPQQVMTQPAVSYQHQPQFGQPQGYGQPQMQYHQAGQPMIQPGGYPPSVIIVAATPIANPPPDHLIFNIMMTLFCCWPIGICAIMKSWECRNAILTGDKGRADTLSAAAKRLGMWALGIGVITIAILFIMYITMFLVV